MTPAQQQLIERLEAATGPDRELDAWILCAVEYPNEKPQRNFFYTNREEWGVFITDQPKPGITFHDAPLYTASIDAALTLVPEGWHVGTFNSGDKSFIGHPNSLPFVCLRPDQTNDAGWQIGETTGQHLIAAIALCIAALRARFA